MRTLLFITGGIILWLFITGIARWFGNQTAGSWLPTIAFTIIWFMFAGWNMWVGVTQAGYTFMEELPIFLLIYLLPVVIAAIVKSKMLS